MTAGTRVPGRVLLNQRVGQRPRAGRTPLTATMLRRLTDAHCSSPEFARLVIRHLDGTPSQYVEITGGRRLSARST